MEFDIARLEDWPLVAQTVLRSLDGRTNLLLSGSLGAGKTSFTTALVECLGGSESDVQSPTFSIVHEYTLKSPDQYYKVYHLDLYRLKQIEEATALGLYDMLDAPDLVLIEWPEMIMPILQKDEYVHLFFEHQNSGRRLTLEK